jgi:hypothetical protein
LWLEKWGQTSYARESLIDPYSRFLYQPLRGFSGVCRLELPASMNAYQQEMRRACKRGTRRTSSSDTAFRA